jgi:hypothetical protein
MSTKPSDLKALGFVVVERDGQVVEESQHLVLVEREPVEQIARGACRGAASGRLAGGLPLPRVGVLAGPDPVCPDRPPAASVRSCLPAC